MAKNFSELKEEVRNIDPEAGEYLDKIDMLGYANNSRFLRGVMRWAGTPQGLDFWLKIEDQLSIDSVR